MVRKKTNLKKNKTIQLKLNSKIYKLKSIKQAIKDYSHLGEFNLKQDKVYILVNIVNVDKDYKDVIKDEFCNYILYLLKSK